MKDYLERMRVPEKFWNARIDLVQERPRRVIEKYVTGITTYLARGWGLLFWGDFGTGKSAAASVLMKLGVAEKGRTGLWVFADDIPGLLIDNVQYDEHETYRERILSVDLLMVDELVFHSKRDSFADTSVEMLFRRRVAMNKSTCFTTNLSPTEIKKAYPALSNVMLECLCPVKFDHQFRETLSKDISKEFE